MVKRASIDFMEASQPIREPVTKFGGQPVWLETPQWPLSRSTGRPMRFLCQIALDPALFGDTSARMAYLFMTDEDDYVDGTWEPDSGENAVILQPGEAQVPIQALETGPTLYRMVTRPRMKHLVPEPCEFDVQLTFEEDPDFVPSESARDYDEAQMQVYYESQEGNKVGGVPVFLQCDEFPGETYTTLLLQLDSTCVPFDINFGDAGVGYAFLSDDRRTGKFLWQCL